MQAVEVDVVADESGLAALAPEWNRIHEGAATASVFNSWMWRQHWWDVYGAGRPLRVLRARRGGETVGVLPMYLEATQAAGTTIRVLRPIGTGGDTYPDDLDPVLAAGCEADAARALADALLSLEGADVVLATDLAAGSPFAAALEQAARSRGLACRRDTAETIQLLELPRSWDLLLAAQTPTRRTRMRKHRRKAAAAGARFIVWEDAATLDGVVHRLAHLHCKRWEAAGEDHSFASEQYLEFHRRVIHGALRAGWLRLYCLEVDGELAAITYAYRFRNRVFLVQAGFDPDRASMHPGSVLLGHLIEHAIDEGNEVLDFLRGRHRYKDDLSNAMRETHTVSVLRSTPGAWAWRAKHYWVPALRDGVKAGIRSIYARARGSA